MLYIAVSGHSLQWFKKSLQSFQKVQLSCTASVRSSIYRRRSTLMLRIIMQPLFELFTLLLCGQSQLFKVETYCSRTGAYCYGVKNYYNQQFALYIILSRDYMVSFDWTKSPAVLRYPRANFKLLLRWCFCGKGESCGRYQN